MSLQPSPIALVPEETARVARAAFPKGTRSLEIRDVLGTISPDEMFADLFSRRGQPTEAPWRLALVTVFQFLEGCSDRQAAEAVRGRIDWKYALGLELSDAVRAFGLRQARYSGLAKTNLQEIGTAVALDLCRRVDWHRQKPRAKTRTSLFAALARIA